MVTKSSRSRADKNSVGAEHGTHERIADAAEGADSFGDFSGDSGSDGGAMGTAGASTPGRRVKDHSNRPTYFIIGTDAVTEAETILWAEKTIGRIHRAYGRVTASYGRHYRDFRIVRVKTVGV